MSPFIFAVQQAIELAVPVASFGAGWFTCMAWNGRTPLGRHCG